MRVYPLDNRGLTGEQMAVAFAMTSRSPEPFDEIAQRVSEEQAAGFHERWVLDYGHASVAEHAVVHLAVENISRLACDELENNRLASYTEKSSRYQVIQKDAFHVPEELRRDEELRREYVQDCRTLFGAYAGLLAQCRRKLAEQQPKRADEGERDHSLRIRRQATDACRGVLPAATLTNVGMTANARTLEHGVSKLMSTGLEETRTLGETLRQQAKAITPTLIRRADRNEYLAKPPQDPGEALAQEGPGADPPQAKLCRFDPDAPRNLALALLYRNGRGGYAGLQAKLQDAGQEEIRGIVENTLEGMGPHGQPPREFETVVYTLELRMDYGALREFRRHRMMTPLFQPLTVRHGVNAPAAIAAAGAEREFMEATETAERLHGRLAAHSPELAQYAVTHAHVQQTLVHLNLRELYHIVRLRTSGQAHESIRGPVQAALKEIARVHPELAAPLVR